MPMKSFLLAMTLAAALPAGAASINFPVRQAQLDNGLRILIVPDTNVAVVSCRLYYFVGSMYEGPGTTGLSHMFEHMMFKGTKRLGTHNYAKEKPIMARIDSLESRIAALMQSGVQESDSPIVALRAAIFAQLDKQRSLIKKDEIWELYLNNGGTRLNAWTGDDMTAYIVTLPKNKVELFYWIESDRMANPVLREFFSERDVVTEERRMRVDNRPLGKYWERLSALFFVAHPFRQPTIGWMSDIRAYTRAKLEEHVRRFYTPDNAVIVLVGNVNADRAIADIKRYFGPIPRAAVPKQEVVTREPAPIGETRFTLRDDAQPRIDMLFLTPGYPSDDLYRLDILEGMLSGRSGRLYRRLVTREQLCTDAGASNAVMLHNSYFHVYATLRSEADPAQVEKIIREELAALHAGPPRTDEMERITNSIKMDYVQRLGSLEGLSDQLAWFERLRDWRDMLSYPDNISRVDPATVAAAAARHLDPSRATIGMLLPPQTTSLSTESK